MEIRKEKYEKKKKNNKEDNQKKRNDKITVTGKVVDERNQPLPGATIVIRGSRRGITSAADGTFTLDLPNRTNLYLDVSFIGMKPQAIHITKSGNITIKLKENAVALQEAAVIANGFYSENKNTYTGAATKISKEELLKVSNINPITAIVALTPGMSMVDNNASGSNPNAIPDLIIRGTTSLITDEYEGANSPLVIMDGVEITLEELYDLDIHEIENVTVLKDAS